MTEEKAIDIVNKKARYMGGGIYMLEYRNKSFMSRDTRCLVKQLLNKDGE